MWLQRDQQYWINDVGSEELGTLKTLKEKLILPPLSAFPAAMVVLTLIQVLLMSKLALSCYKIKKRAPRNQSDIGCEP